jgi:hypothetical protein
MQQLFSSRTLRTTALGIGLLIPALAVGPGFAPTPAPAIAASVDDLGDSIAGTWVEHWDGGGLLMNFGADGTLHWTGSWFQNPSFPNSLVYGSWEETGLREITSVEVGFLHYPSGALWGIGRVVEVFTFDEDFETCTYSGYEELFEPDVDPTDPDAVPVDLFSWEGGLMRRLPQQ